jgi:hypothetical protein
MPTHASTRRRGPREPADRTPGIPLIAFPLIAVVAVAGLGAWASATAAAADRPRIIASSAAAVAVALLSGALALARGRAVRRLRGQIVGLEAQLANLRTRMVAQNTRIMELADRDLPIVVRLLRDGASSETALA